MNRYTPKRILGAGGFGVVFLCHDANFEEEVAVKALHIGELDRNITDVFREAQILRRVASADDADRGGGRRLPGEQVVIGGQVERLGLEQQLARGGVGFCQVDLPGELQLVFGAIGGREGDEELAQAEQLLPHRAVQLEPGGER